ncbi:glycosyltransferase family 2 protein [Chrysiogenes arsenatis]|uniref:glycosyltransferase family 2 protein n=1 Tax=Chrysiogenes arsenatis TaxID=309797 RepID=UPI00191C68C9|nr:glycosyltransferase family 2 protein [Chrysiogenes arsenatis]
MAAQKKAPKISIGMPVYNGENSIKKAIESIIQQTFTDFELIISDNASIDGTESICIEYAAKDKRIRYVRQRMNLGAIANFQFVLDEAVGEYFMWAAADDIRSLDFLELNLTFLEKNKDFVASTSPVRFENNSFNAISMGCFSLDMDDFPERAVKFFTGWHANGRYYSLIRRNSLLGFCLTDCDILGGDWYLVLFLAKKGKLACVSKGELILGAAGVSNSTNIFARYNTNLLNFIIPFNRLFIKTEKLIARMPLSLRLLMYFSWIKLSYSALKLNLLWKLFPRKRKDK